MKNFKFTMMGRSPMIVHNGNNISALDPVNKLKKEFTNKRTKTDDDHLNILRIQWYQSLYLDGDFELGLVDGSKYYAASKDLPSVVLPIKCVKACVKSGAKHSKNGKALDRAVLFAGVEFYRPSESGKKLGFPDINKMSDDPRYIDETAMTVGRAKVIRRRAKFDQWAAEVTGILAEEMLNPGDLLLAAEMAGHFEGINDSRSYGYGRFTVQDFSLN